MRQLDTPRFDDLVFDIGMHEGQDSYFYLAKGFRVVAIEADPDLVMSCQRRFHHYIETGRLTIIEGAIVNPNVPVIGGRVCFYKNLDLSVWGTIRGDVAARNERLGTRVRKIEVETLDLKRIIETHGVPHYMKIDIEGADVQCLRVLSEFMERPSYLSIESDKVDLRAVKDEIESLVELGYDRFQAIEQGSIPVVQRPPNPSREGTFVDHEFEEGCSGLFGAELSGRWRTRSEILRRYRMIFLGYRFLGDDGLMKSWRFFGAGLLRVWMEKFLSRLTQAPVPGWYDTHARHATVVRITE